MRFVLNKCYGGWSISKFAQEKLGVHSEYADLDAEGIGKLADLIEEFGSEICSGSHARLEVIEVPDECTDYEYVDYDGVESITYVVDGKLYHA